MAKPRPVPGNGGNGSNPIEDDPIVQGLDQIDRLRVEMRTAGMQLLAGLLDEAFAIGLREYVQVTKNEDLDGPNPAKGRRRRKQN